MAAAFEADINAYIAVVYLLQVSKAAADFQDSDTFLEILLY